MQRPQTPGRIEALRAVLQGGIANASPELLRLAGMGREIQRRPPEPDHGAIEPFASGVETLPEHVRSSLPF